MAELSEAIDAINRELAELPLREVEHYETTAQTIDALRTHHARISAQRGWRGRNTRNLNLHQIEQSIAEHTQQRENLLQRIGDPAAITAHAEALHERRRELAAEHRSLHERLVAEEIDRAPRWLHNAIGPEPEALHLQSRWQRTARELAGYRLEHEITDPEHALGPMPGSDTSARAIRRALSDTRHALGIEPEGPGGDVGYDLGR